MNKLTILDGGMGRELKRMGAPFSQPLWSAQALIESPEIVTLAHKNFIHAGAEIIIANSYACVPFHLGQKRYESDGARLAKEAAILAQDAVAQTEKQVKVAGALPPAFGSYRPDLFDAVEGEKIFRTLFEAQEPYVDIWLAETISSIEEFDVIQSVLLQTPKTCYYAFSLQDTPSNTALIRSGQSVREVTQRVCESGDHGVYFNCSVPEVMSQAIQDAKQVIDELNAKVEIGVYANNFAPIGSDHEANDTIQAMRELSPQDYLVYSKQWHQLGATTIGGCCGIGPEHIQALSDWKLSQHGESQR
jgi:S-methylmethionine-dependent homocysteine/selenocysteine methylase